MLKVPHHGRLDALSGAFFAAAAPQIAVVTSDEDEPEDDEVIALLREQGAQTLLTREGITGLFDAICGSLPNGNNSEKWQIVSRVMESLGAVPEETVLVGDTKYDVLGAHRCGIKCIGVEYGYAAPGELAAAGADYILPDIPALESFLIG